MFCAEISHDVVHKMDWTYWTYVRIFDVVNLPPPNERRHLILLPALDGRRVPGGEVQVVAREHADAEPNGCAGGKVEDEEEDVGECRFGLGRSVLGKT